MNKVGWTRARNPWLVELRLDVGGVADRVQRVLVRDAVLVSAVCPRHRHTRSGQQTTKLRDCAVHNLGISSGAVAGRPTPHHLPEIPQDIVGVG